MIKSPFLAMERGQQRSALEALLFASDDALSARALYKLLIEADEQAAQQEQQEQKEQEESTLAPDAEADVADGDDAVEQAKNAKQPSRQAKMKELTLLFDELVAELNDELESTGRAFRIVKVAGGYQFATTAMHGELVARLVKSKSKRRLSQAALETLAIVAYRQPITKPEIESIRGVSCNEVVNTLLEKNLVTIAGRSETIGKPLLYGTTDEFLRAFGLHDIADLPKPRELEELMESRADILNAETVVIAEGEKVEDFEERLHSLGKKGEESAPMPEQATAKEAESAEATEGGEHAETRADASEDDTANSADEHGSGEGAAQQPSEHNAEFAGEQQPEERSAPNTERETPEPEEQPEPLLEIRKMRVVMASNGRPR